MLLSEFVKIYCAEHDLADSTIGQYRLAALAFERWAAQPLQLSEITPAAINEHLRAMKSRGRADTSRHSRRRDLTLLLRAAIARGDLAGFDFDRVLRVKVCDRVTRAWTREQVEHLLAVTEQMRGVYSTGIARATFWRSYVLTAWDSGLRSCDILSLEYSWLAASGSFTIIQRKTGERHRVQLADATREAIRVSMVEQPKRALIWPLWGRREAFSKAARKLLRLAGLSGSLKWLRRSSATDLEREHPGSAGRHLGHKTPGLAERFYLDFDQLANDRPKPRPLAPQAIDRLPRIG